MDKTIEQVKQLAHRYGVPKLVLFGSRARGDYRARSDYDFAVWGCTAQQRAQFSDAVEMIWTRCIRLIWCLSTNIPMPHCLKI